MSTISEQKKMTKEESYISALRSIKTEPEQAMRSLMVRSRNRIFALGSYINNEYNRLACCPTKARCLCAGETLLPLPGSFSLF